MLTLFQCSILLWELVPCLQSVGMLKKEQRKNENESGISNYYLMTSCDPLEVTPDW